MKSAASPGGNPSYTALDPDKIIVTMDTLSRRIGERFPHSGLFGVAKQLLGLTHRTKERARTIARPLYWLRLANFGLILLIVAGIGGLILSAISYINMSISDSHLIEFVQGVEAGINDLILIGAGLFFLMTWETRLKRKRALKALHELRAIAHVIDMHQLTKDPDHLLNPGSATPSSPVRDMTPHQLSRYLDYCSELLSLTGKLAALYVQDFDDPVVLAATNDIESLTTDLSRKIWQKLMIVHSVYHTVSDDEQG